MAHSIHPAVCPSTKGPMIPCYKSRAPGSYLVYHVSSDVLIASKIEMKFSLRKVLSFILSRSSRRSSSLSSSSPESRPPKPKKVHWGNVVVISYSPISKQPALRPIPGRSSSCRKPIIKRPTPFDLEMMHKNLWNVVSIADKKLELHHQLLSHCDDKLLERVLKHEDRLVHEISNMRARETSSGSGPKLKRKVGRQGKRLKRKKWQMSACL